MSYASVEASVHAGAPIHLFEFVQGATTWRYTSRGADVSALSQSWVSAPIEMGNIAQTTELGKNNLKLSFPRDHAFASQFLGYAQEAVTSVTIWRGHEGDGEYIVHWKGRVAGSAYNDPKIDLDCENIFTSLRRTGLRRRWQKTCPHLLYGRGCTLNKDNFAEASLAVSISGLTLTIQTAQADGWFTGGMVKAPDGSLRFVMAHAGQVLTLIRPHEPLADLVAVSGYGINYGNYYGGIPLTLYPGCDRSIEICDSKFSNKLNCGCYKWIPIKNPMAGSSIV